MSKFRLDKIVTIETQPRVRDIHFNDDGMFSVQLADGRIVLVPLAWYPRLAHATEQERDNWRVFEDSDERDVIFWESLDELIPVVAGDGPELEAVTGFDEGPVHPDWRGELERRGIEVISGVLRDEAIAVYHEFAASNALAYNARAGQTE